MLLSRPLALIAILSGLLATADGKADNAVFTINVAPSTSTKDVQVRYFLGGPSGVVFSSSMAIGSSDKIVIQTDDSGKAATSFKAIAFSPGCQFVTYSVDDLPSSNRLGEFECQKLPTALLQGKILLAGMEGKELQVEVLYVCNWAAQLFNIGPGAVSPFWLAKTPVASDGTFSIELPDFPSDPLWDSFSKDAFLSFHLVDANTGHPIGALAPPAALSQGSLLRVATSYPGEIVFTAQAPVTTK